MNWKRIKTPAVIVIILLTSIIGVISIPTKVNLNVDALRFSESSPEQSSTEAISMVGTITRRLNGTRLFDGILTIGGKKIECSMNLRAPIFREYRGSQLHTLGMFLLIDGNFDSAAIKLNTSPAEYIIWGMTLEEFLAQEMR